MKSLKFSLKSAPLVYITRDLERALGASPKTPHYYIVTNRPPKMPDDPGHDKNILYISEKAKLDTLDLLKHDQTAALLRGLQNPRVLVFKNTLQIEKKCRDNGWPLLNPPAELTNSIEEKLSQLNWLGPLQKFLPPFKVIACKHLTWTGEPYIIQFNRAHTGQGTILVDNENQIIALRNTFPNREVRVTQFVRGPVFTNNNVIWGKNILSGPLNYQITGLAPFTSFPFATVGNDWELPHKLLTKKQHKEYLILAAVVGKRLVEAGWKGLFGLDTIVDEKTGQLYLLEINARQPASTTYESQLQSRQRAASGLTTFEAHLSALYGLPYKKEKIIPLVTGAQIVQRVTPNVTTIDPALIEELSNIGASTIVYHNEKTGADLLRIQVKKGIMTGHSVFNALGTEIAYSCDPNKNRGYRAGVLLIKNKRILLMKRFYNGQHYYSITGGKPEDNESLREAAAREGQKETNLSFEITNRPPVCVQQKRREVYFFTTGITGEAVLGGPEKERNNAENSFELAWVDKKTLRALRLRQIELKPLLLKLL